MYEVRPKKNKKTKGCPMVSQMWAHSHEGRTLVFAEWQDYDFSVLQCAHIDLPQTPDVITTSWCSMRPDLCRHIEIDDDICLASHSFPSGAHGREVNLGHFSFPQLIGETRMTEITRHLESFESNYLLDKDHYKITICTKSGFTFNFILDPNKTELLISPYPASTYAPGLRKPISKARTSSSPTKKGSDLFERYLEILSQQQNG